jgi:hypothetical protein
MFRPRRAQLMDTGDGNGGGDATPQVERRLGRAACRR